MSTRPAWSSRVGPGPRPWTDAGLAAAFERPHLEPGPPVFYADSAARQQLARALVRYVRREITGSSYLLAADPGAGKTTTIEWVVQQLYYECLSPRAGVRFNGHRPLLVRLYGPNLAPVRDRPADATESPPPKRRYSPVLQLLRDMAVSLFESVIAEIERTIRYQLLPDQRRTSDDFELFLQVRHEMRRGPALADLMAYWDRLGWGERGAFSREPTHRGAAEVAVLQDLAEARLAVVSEVQDRRDTKGSSEAERRVERVVQPTDLLKTSTAIVAGVAASAGLVADGSWILAGILGPLVTAGVGAGLSFTNRSSRRQSRQDERAYTLKADVESLIHRIPRLLQGLRQIGLHPVFVVDELDKVGPELVTYLVDNLKTQVTEQSFFCFLTDTASAPAPADGTRSMPRVAYRHFRDRIYLFQTTPALHGYLQMLLAEPEAAEGDQREAVVMLRAVLLLRAEHHPLRLHRELDRARREGWLTRIDEEPRALLHDPTMRVRLRFALVTEWAMAELAAETANDPQRLRIAKDVLYRPWRSWQANEPGCTITRLEIYREVRDATEDRDFAGHVAWALDTLLDELAVVEFTSDRAPDDARTRAYLGVQRPPERLSSEPIVTDPYRRRIEAHAHRGSLLDRETGTWLERPIIVQELDIDSRLKQLSDTPCVQAVGGLAACVDVLFDEPPSAALIVQREQSVLALAFVARVLAVSLEQTHARALEAAGLLVEPEGARISRAAVEQLGRHLGLDDLDDLIEAADAASLEAALRARHPLSSEQFERLERSWHDDWIRRLSSPRDEHDRGSVLDPIAMLRDWPRRALWRWRQPAEQQPGPERSIALWSEIVYASFTGALPLVFGLLALTKLGFPLEPTTVERALRELEGHESTPRLLHDALGRRRPAPQALLVLETYPGGAGEDWACDPTYPTLVLDTDRDDAREAWAWVHERLAQDPPARLIRLGRMNIDYISPDDALDAYLLQRGHLKVPGSSDRPVISDPGGPQAVVEALRELGRLTDEP